VLEQLHGGGTVSLRFAVVVALVGAAACGSPSELPVQTKVLDGETVTNGSFEQNYTGWTVSHNPNEPGIAIWGIATNGETIEPGTGETDFATNTQVGYDDEPFTYVATDGNQVAYIEENGPADHRMFQDITVPNCQAVVRWDIAYIAETSLSSEEFLALNIRDLSDNILATPFETTSASPQQIPTMTEQVTDISSFAGQTVRLDFEAQIQIAPFQIAFDNIRVVCKGLSPTPSALAFGNVPVGSFANQTTTITNESSSTISLGQLTTSPAGSTFAVTGEPSLPDAIAPGGSAQVTVTFAPSGVGSASGTLTLSSDDPNGNTVIPLTGTGLGASLSVSPTSLTFPTTQVNDTSPTQPVTIQNVGGASLTVSSISVPSPFIATASTPFTLEAGGSATFDVAFSPNVAGTANATLVVESTDGEIVNVACTGSGAAAAIALSPSSVGYAAQAVGTQSATQPIIVNNTGVGAITLQTIAATAPFVVVNQPTLPTTLPAGGSAEIDVAFAPTANGLASGALTIGTLEAGSASASLTGTGIAPVISAAISSFGNQHVDTTGTQLLVITNNGTAPLDISGLTTAAPFSVTTTTATIGVGSAQSFPVSFTPTQVGTGSGTVTVTSDDPVTPSLAVPVTGTGTIGIVQFSPGSLGFGNQRTGTVSSLPVTITNIGTGNLDISSAGVAGGPFSGALGATVVAPGSAAQMTVTFQPSVDGAASTTLSVISDSPTSPDTMTVTGTGVEPIATPSVTSVSFGNQRVGTTSSPAQTVTVRNTGTAALTISSFGTTGPFSTTGPSMPVVLAIGQSAQFSTAFSPTATGTANGALSIGTNATTSPSIALSGTGTAPAIAASPTSLGFGNQRLDTTSSSQTVTVTNTGTASLAITGATPPAGFVVTPPSAFPIHVLPNATAAFGVAFAPTTLGAASAAVVFASDAGTASATVTGTGVQAVASMSPTSQDFGSVRIGSTSAAQALSIVNTGNDSFTVTGITVPAPFVLVTGPSLPASVAGGASLPVSVELAPTAVGSAAGLLSVSTDAGFVSATLTGQGVASAIAASLDPIQYGTVSVNTTSTLALQLSNPGTAPLTISKLQLGGANAGDFALTPQPSLPATVPVGDALTVDVAFTPTALGDRSAQLVAVSDALGSSSLSIGLDGRGIGAHAVLSPASLDFGSTIVGSASPPLAVTIANTGDDQLVVSAIVLGGANGGDFTESQALPLVIPAGSASPIAFQFAPTAGGERTATATFQTSDPFAPTSTLSLVGGGQTPTIVATPADVAFGPVRVGSDASLPLVLSNQGSGSLTITALSLAGSNADFTLAPVTLPISVAPNGSTTLQVSYAPTAIASEAATLSVTSDDPVNGTLAVPVSGIGVSPAVTVTPSALDFGGELVGRASAPRQVTIQNTGTGTMSVTSLGFSGAQSAVFLLVNPPNLPATISAGSQLVLSATVAPSMVGADGADLAIATNITGATAATVHMTVVGISTALAVSPTSLDFGTAHAGSATKAQTITLSNLSSDAITLTDGVVIGMTPTDFTIGAIAGTLAAGSSATATVTYDPAAAANSAATIDFGTSDPTIPDAQVAVTGRSVSTFLAANATKLAFGAIEVGGESGAHLVTIENITTAPLAIAGISAADPQFAVDSTGVPATLAAGATAQFGVTFAPTREGSAASTLAITLTGASSPELAIALTGEGADRPSVGGCSAGGDARSLAGLVALGLALLRRRRRSPRAR
jgi:hypothetical protein